MKKSVFRNILGLSVALAMLIQCLCGVVFATEDSGYSNGGEVDDGTFRIGTYAELAAFRNAVNGGDTDADAILTADIDISSEASWGAIAAGASGYSGTFDGNGHKITGFTQTPTYWYGGFFKWTNGATIKNLTIEGSVASTSAFAGGYIGRGTGTTITDCKFIGNVTTSDNNAGGFIAKSDESSASYNNITRCAFIGNVADTSTNAGTAFGIANHYTYVKDSYVVGDISGFAEVAGIGTFATATNCFIYGNITATNSAFRVANTGAANCYYLNATATTSLSGRGTKATDYEFKSGKVAYLLGDAFGQTIGTDNYPVFATEDNAVILNENNEYINEGGEPFGKYVWEIGTYAELAAFRDAVNGGDTGADAILTADIDISSEASWGAIAAGASGYSGTFDGNGHKITGFTQTPTYWYGGFFKWTNGATIKNLTIEGSVVSTSAYAGGYIGRGTGTTITDCKFIGNVATSDNNAGGFIAYSEDASSNLNTVTRCAFIGNVADTSTNAGTAFGIANHYTTVTDSYVVGDISGHNNVAGVGWHSTAINCFAYGTITAEKHVCRIAETATNSYYLNSKSTSLAGEGIQVSADVFASGAIAYALGDAFGQTIGTDIYPVFATEDNKVIRLSTCEYINLGDSIEITGIYDAEDTEIIDIAQLSGGDEIIAKLGYKLSDQTVTCIIGFYDKDGILLNSDIDEVPCGETEAEFTAPRNLSDVCGVKVFVWEDMSVFVPKGQKLFISNGLWQASDELSDNSAFNLVTTFHEDEGTTRGFAWSSLLAHSDMAIRYAQKDAEWYGESILKEAEYTEFSGRLYYKVDIDNLEPGETYVYKIGDMRDDVWSDFYTFTTEPDGLTEFSFIGVTDPQSAAWTNGFEYYEMTLDEAIEDEPNAAFMINLGDMVEDGPKQEEWDYYFKATKGITESIPHMAVVGNHETRGAQDTAVKHFALQFNNPQNGKYALGDLTVDDVESSAGKGIVNNIEGTIYSFDYGNAHFAVLNTGTDGSETDTVTILTEQAKWLKQDLDASDKKWKIVMIHQGMYPAKTERYDTREPLLAVIDECKVDLVLQGHDHMVARTYPMRGDEIVSTVNPASVTKGTGTIYAILGAAGPKRYEEVAEIPEYMAMLKSTAINQPTYSLFTVNNEKISVITKQIDGTVVDSFEIADAF